MIERQAWFCPACRKHHAPNVWPQPSTAAPQPTINPYWTATGVHNPPVDPNLICINGAH